MSDSESELAPLLKILAAVYEQKLPFNRLLGFSVESADRDGIRVRVDMRPELVGNFVLKTLHGGVISAVFDAAGGMMASVGVLERLRAAPPHQIEQALTRVGTIDLRVDYLRPGKGRFFVTTAQPMRLGKRVAVIRMAMHNDEKVLVAVGTGTYIVG